MFSRRHVCSASISSLLIASLELLLMTGRELLIVTSSSIFLPSNQNAPKDLTQQSLHLLVPAKWKAVKTDQLPATSTSAHQPSKKATMPLCSVWPNMSCFMPWPSHPSSSPTGRIRLELHEHQEMIGGPQHFTFSVYNVILFSSIEPLQASTSTVRTLTYPSWRTAMGPVQHTVTALVTEAVVVSEVWPSWALGDFWSHCMLCC